LRRSLNPQRAFKPGLREAAFTSRDIVGGVGFRLNSKPKTSFMALVDGQPTELHISEVGVIRWNLDWTDSGVVISNDDGQLVLFEPSVSRGVSGGGEADGALISPMPGKIIAVEVRQGDQVAKGQKLLTLEAMKMEHSLTAPFDGVVAELSAVTGGQVSEGTLLARIEKGEGA
jgi:3-methylcrotonyl-CoA carboxylase alpha subunit